ncbi:hypothetical protein D3C73_1035310 [compost metagenome]
MPISSDSMVMERSYPRSMGNLKASMPMKCIDHTPTPMANAPPAVHQCTARPLAVAIRPVRSSAVYEARIATQSEMMTSVGE